MSKEPDIVEVEQLRPMLQDFNSELGQYINADQRYKLGRVLTVIDASIADPEQRRALKNIVEGIWWGNDNRVSETKMTSPHTDIRAICRALGFELYPETDSSLLRPVAEDSMLNWTAERYSRIADESIRKVQSNN